MPIPRVQLLKLPVLMMTADGAEHSTETLREGVRKSGINVLVNRVAWALAHLVMGNAILLKRENFYQITERGLAILKENPRELTIKALL